MTEAQQNWSLPKLTTFLSRRNLINFFLHQIFELHLQVDCLITRHICQWEPDAWFLQALLKVAHTLLHFLLIFKLRLDGLLTLISLITFHHQDVYIFFTLFDPGYDKVVPCHQHYNPCWGTWNHSHHANIWSFKENKKVSATIRATLTVLSEQHTGTVLCHLAIDEAGVTNTCWDIQLFTTGPTRSQLLALTV